MNGIAEAVRQLRGTSVNQVGGVEHVLVTRRNQGADLWSDSGLTAGHAGAGLRYADSKMFLVSSTISCAASKPGEGCDQARGGDESDVGGQRQADRVDEASDQVSAEHLLDSSKEQIDVVGRQDRHDGIDDIRRRQQRLIDRARAFRKPSLRI